MVNQDNPEFTGMELNLIDVSSGVLIASLKESIKDKFMMGSE